MKNKKIIGVVVVVVLLLCCVAITQKGQKVEQPSSIEIKIRKNFTLQGQAIPSGNVVSMNTAVSEVVITSEDMTIFQNFHMPDDIVFEGARHVTLYMKDGTSYDLWRNCKDKWISHENDTNEAETHIVFSERLPLGDMESFDLEGENYKISQETN